MSNYRPPGPQTPKHSHRAKRGYPHNARRHWDRQRPKQEDRGRIVNGVYRA